MSSRTQSFVGLAFLVFSAQASAQFGNAWAEFQRVDGRILDATGAVATSVTTDPQEKDYAFGDLDQDGWTDLVVVRKQPNEGATPFPNVLLMNEGGWLIDRSAQYASAADVAGDNGFLTPTNDRDVVVVDVDMNGWLDVVTAVSFAAGQPKHISHPRVYVNLGSDANGDWLGLRFENARIPLLSPAPYFQGVAAGDVTGDGAPDLYFTDSGTLNDKLLVNDGNGNFSDSGTMRMSATMLNSAYGISATMADVNLDGALDVVRCAQIVSVAYNDPANVGFFSGYQPQVGSGAPYHAAVGDLNRDLRPDLICVDDSADQYRYNTANATNGQVVWGPLKFYQFLTGGEISFGGNIVVADLDGDGWNDTIHADVDVQISGCVRRAYIYHNPGGTVGAQITLLEEAESSSGGWRGAKGFLASDLVGTYDIAVFDLDRDDDLDIVLGRCSGTFVWLNQRNDCPLAQYTYGAAIVNSTGQEGSIGSNGLTSLAANQLVLSASGLPPSKAGLFLAGTQRLFAAAPFGNGNRWIGGTIGRFPVQLTDANGNASLAVDLQGAPAAPLFPGDVRGFQFWHRDPAAGGAAANVTDAIEIVLCP